MSINIPGMYLSHLEHEGRTISPGRGDVKSDINLRTSLSYIDLTNAMTSSLDNIVPVSCLLIFCFISVWLVQNTYALLKENGVIGQIIGDNKTQFYVSGVKEFTTSGSKSVEISIVFKNFSRQNR
jgi:hypothetical protein